MLAIIKPVIILYFFNLGLEPSLPCGLGFFCVFKKAGQSNEINY